jgi:NADPH:quinone reductase-like Zn-dependent oxidoreductase
LEGFNVIATAGNEQSIKYLEDLGISKNHIVNYKGLSVKDLRSKVIEANGNKPVDAAVDLFGSEMKQLAMTSIKFGGQVVSIVEEPDPNYPLPFFPSQSPEVNLFFLAGTFHLVFVGGRAFQSKEEWPIIGKQLNELAKIFEENKLKVGIIQNVGNLSGRCHQLLKHLTNNY